MALAAGGGARGLHRIRGCGGEVGWWWGCFAGEDGRGGVSVDGGFGAGLVAVWWVGPGVLDYRVEGLRGVGSAWRGGGVRGGEFYCGG